jgi:ubiquinone/menaquinone biosynthesis C-methylase UbiE
VVLEIGAGTGVNLNYYPDSISNLTLSEPDPQMRRQLIKKLAETTLPHKVIATSAEELPFADHSFDTVVATLVFCSVEHPERCLGELHRVLKPGGKLAVIEHVGAAEQQNVYKWQKRIEPFWKRCAGNCHLTRDTLTIMQRNGFNCDNLQPDSMRGATFFVAPTIRGIAEKAEELADFSNNR